LKNAAFTPALETTLTGVTLKFEVATFVSVTGAIAKCTLNGSPVNQHVTIAVKRNDILVVGSAEKGVRSYVAFAGGLKADEVLGSVSTYMTAEFGGHKGRALQAGDELELSDQFSKPSILKTPANYRLPMLDSWSLRAGRSCETMSVEDPAGLFETKLTIGGRSDRMGIKLEGEKFKTDSSGQMPSVPVFPGIIQCPQDGNLFILSVDAGTTGGYPRVAKIARMDLHLLGQLRPGNSLNLIERTDEDAAHELRKKHAYWSNWLPDIGDII
jgi:allophanate hydrolase